MMDYLKSNKLYLPLIIILILFTITACGSTYNNGDGIVRTYKLTKLYGKSLPVQLRNNKIWEATLTLDHGKAKISGTFGHSGTTLTAESTCKYSVSGDKITFSQIEVGDKVFGTLVDPEFVNDQRILKHHKFGTFTTDGNIIINLPIPFANKEGSLLFEKK
jgi:hypothetical protein